MAQKTAGKSVKGQSILQSAVKHHVEDLSTFVVIRGLDQMFYDVLPTLICVASHVEIQ